MSQARDRHNLMALDKRLPATLKWYKGPTAPPVNGHMLVFWEDTANNVAKILMKRSNTTYVFLATEGSAGTYVLNTRQVIAGTLLTGGGALSADVTLNVDEASIDHDNITNVGSNAHSVIDTHLGSESNPHSVTASQVAAVPLYEQSAEPSDPGGFAFWRDTDDNAISYWSEGNSRWQRLL